MLEIKAHHKELKRAVNEVESKRKQDRSNKDGQDQGDQSDTKSRSQKDTEKSKDQMELEGSHRKNDSI